MKFSSLCSVVVAVSAFASTALATEVPLTPVQKGGPIQLPVPASRTFFTKNSGCSRLPVVVGQQAGKDGEFSDNKITLDSIACLNAKSVTISRTRDGAGNLQISLQLGFQRPGTTPVFVERSFVTSFDWKGGAATVPAGTFYTIDMPEISVQPALDAQAKAIKVYLQLQLPERDIDAPTLSFKLVNKKPDALNAAEGQLITIPTFERYN